MTAVTHAEPGAVDCVLLDVDGTLIDSTYLHALAWQRAFARHQLDVPWWETHFAIGMGGDLLVPHLGGPAVEERIGEQLRAQWAEEYRAVLPEVRAIPGAADLVGHLVAAGHRVALASSGADEFTDAALSLLGLDRDDFAAVTSSDDAERSKPAPDLLRAAMDSAGGSTAVLVGDSVWDAQAANQMSIPFVGVRTGGIAESDLLGAGASRVVDSVVTLVDESWRP
ncbi:HAD family hydrolase [Mycolicibacterium brumae]|uniref:HAD family hydrolase n=1 Tax=Mycolicibacterium brumae TaxID=85968 RepID=A0A2G5PF12_9MYCO|nr:HAD family hydrolase [Mycolicibacterium brumae]MCV7192730.1 HAD family hydrolase [Mycolicibacterium brumae]PIB76534.1 HAD family hydrolase [Mycolicibacterium brumae]RWA23316.1 hypothetical protein MBRU_00420 [Mycolicibacterium brumae DSM 44177]UWW08756.1 HAD family hydrolase [Mycolicibacterium brumae]